MSLVGCQATLSVLFVSSSDKTQQKTHRVKRRTRRDMGLSHGWQSFMNFSSMSPSHGLQLFIKCCSAGPFPQGAVLQEQPAPAWDPHRVTILTANLVLCGPPPQGHRFCQEPVSAQTSQTTASFKYPPAPTWNPAQGDPWRAMDHHCLTTGRTMSCTMGCFGTWNHLLPSCTDLPVCFSHMLSLLSLICCLYCAGFFPPFPTVQEALPPQEMGEAWARGRSALAGTSSIRHGRGFWNLLTEASPQLRKHCLANPIHYSWLNHKVSSWSSWFFRRWKCTEMLLFYTGVELAVPVQAVILLLLEVTTSSWKSWKAPLDSTLQLFSGRQLGKL